MMSQGILKTVIVTSVLLFHRVSGWNESLTATWLKQTLNSQPTATATDKTLNFISIKSAPSESNTLVQCWITSNKQLSTSSCSNGDISVFSGEGQRGLFVASFCGLHDTEMFQASSNAMGIVISTSGLPVGTSLKVEYSTTKYCRTSIYATTYPRYVRTPHYPVSFVRVQDAKYRCEWLLKAPSGYRLRMTLTYAKRGYKPECRRSNVTIYEVESGSLWGARRAVATWCGKSDNTFVSYYNNSIIRSDGQPFLEHGLQVEFIAEPATQCFKEFLVRDGENGTLTSSGYPTTIKQLQVCRWRVRSWRYRMVIRLIMLDSDLDDSPGCTKDSVKVYADELQCRGAIFWLPEAESPPLLLATWCGTDKPAVEFYTSSLMIEFRTGVNHTRNHRGFKLSLGVSEEPQLNVVSLNATTERQRLESPNYPNPFPGIGKWAWKVTSFQSVHVVKFDVQRTDVGGSFSQYCPVGILEVYEGHKEIASKLLDKWCHNKRTTIQSTGRRMMLVFTSYNNNRARKEGFVIDYWAGQYDASIDVDVTGNRSISFPGNRKRLYVSGYEAYWNLTAVIHDHIGVRFTNVSVACPYDAITVHDGGIGPGYQYWRFCGSSDRSYFSSSKKLYIRFTTQTDGGTGFDMSYDVFFYRGCGPNVKELYTLGNSYVHMRSPGYSNNYFDRLRCRWRFISDHSSDGVRLLIEGYDIVSNSGDFCPYDYIRVYNGYYTSSKTFPKICGKDKSVTIDSNSRYLYVEFITDDMHTGKGFKLTYSSLAIGYNTSSKTLPEIFGKDKSVTIDSNSKYLYVEFIIDDMHTGKDFKLTYSSLAIGYTTSSKTLPEIFDSETSEDSSEYNLAGLIIGVIVAVHVVAIAVVLFIGIKRKRRSSSMEIPAINSVRRFENTPMTVVGPRTRTDNFDPPPEYSEVANLAPEDKNFTSPPPTYIEAITEGMIPDEQPRSRGHVMTS